MDANLYKNYTSAKFILNKFAKFCGGHPRADVFQKTAKFSNNLHIDFKPMPLSVNEIQQSLKARLYKK